MKGDRVEIVVAADDGCRTYEIVATRAGRRVEITMGRGIVEVAKVSVRRARFMASRILALVEHPASETRPSPASDPETPRCESASASSPEPARSRSSSRGAARSRASLRLWA
jgi:hypothetical protein